MWIPMWTIVESGLTREGGATEDDPDDPALNALLGGDDLDGEDRLDLVEELDLHLMRAHRADRLVELHIVAVDRVVDPTLDHRDDIGRRDRAEELALLARAGGDDERSAGDELRRERFVLAFALGQAGEKGPPWGLPRGARAPFRP